MLTAFDMLALFNRDQEASAKRLETIVNDAPLDDHTPESPLKEDTDEAAKTVENVGTRHVNINVNVDTKNKEEELLKNIAENRGELRVKVLHNYIERSTIYVTPELIAGQEGFIDNVFNGILNKLGGIVYLFKTALFDGWRDFKRTELKVYHDNRLSSLRSIYRIERGALDHLNLDHPRGMRGDYLSAIAALKAVFNVLNMSDTASKIIEVIDKLDSELYVNNPLFVSLVESTSRDYTKLERDINRAFDSASKIFTEGSDDKAKFTALYGSNAGIEKVMDTILDMEDQFQSVAGIYSKLEKIQNKVKTLSESAKRVKLSSKEVNMLYDLIRIWGFMFEKFSLTINDLYRVNHNVYVNLLVIDKYRVENL